MDAGGGTGSNPLSLPHSLQEAKKKSKFGDRTQKHYLPYEGEKDSSSCSERKTEKKNTNTLNMDVACEAIDGLALPPYLFDIHRVP